MCGIYGMACAPDRPLRHPERLAAMGDRLRHRGPDGSGRIVEPSWALGAERLRIIDPTDRADQPLPAARGGGWLLANGEIYNAPDLRKRYRDYRFRSGTDVEVVHPLLADRGHGGLGELRGMFALAHWDAGRHELLLARDPAGEKPLFYAEAHGEIWFASEIQALLVHPDLDRDLDDRAITAYVALGYIPEPRTPFRAIRKLPAGCVGVWSPGRGLFISSYAYGPTAQREHPRDAADVARSIRESVTTAVRLQLRSDVPVGIFVSGGMDSALIAALATHEVNPSDIHTFTVRFADRGYDEGVHARRLATELGTEHHEASADWQDLEEAMWALVRGMAEPLADPALLPTWLLARRARGQVGVVLSGEGADELFGGYPTYLGHRWAAAGARVPGPLRDAIGHLLSGPAASTARVPIAYLLLRFLETADQDWARRHVTWFGTGLFPLLSADARDRLIEDLAIPAGVEDAVRAAMDLDYRTSLRDGLLVKLDRATMLHGLETRAPFLDPEVVRLSRTLTGRESVGRATTKLALRRAARGLVAPWVLHRRKRGLSVPIAAWINGALRQTIDDLLPADGPVVSGVLPALPIAQLLSEHRQGRRNHARALWALAILQLWHRYWVSGVRHDTR